MSDTTHTPNLYQKLLAIQKHIIGLGKDKKAYGYDYVTGSKVLEHIKPLMNEFGIILKQEVLSIENVRQDYSVKNGNKSEVLSKVMMRFTWIDCATGDKDENLFGANGQNDWDKGVGSALTYAERYFLLKYFHIATDEDDIDNPERKPQEKTSPPGTPAANKTQSAQKQPKSSPPNNNQQEVKEEAKQEGLEPASVKQKTELLMLLNNKLVTNEEKTKMLQSINSLDCERIEKAITKIKGVINERQKAPQKTS
jgi:ribosome-associated translation inhibitor RaiA